MPRLAYIEGEQGRERERRECEKDRHQDRHAWRSSPCMLPRWEDGRKRGARRETEVDIEIGSYRDIERSIYRAR